MALLVLIAVHASRAGCRYIFDLHLDERRLQVPAQEATPRACMLTLV
jgi:hypothetical protein